MKKAETKIFGISFIAFWIALLLGVCFSGRAHGAVASSPITVSSIAALKALSPGQYPVVYVQGYNAGSSEGSGILNWDGTSTATADSCSIFKLNSNPTKGRYIRAKMYDVDVASCGAYGDGVHNDQPKIQAALNYASGQNVQKVKLKGGLTYRCNSKLTIPSGIWLAGVGRRLAGLKFYQTDFTESILFANGYYQKLSDINIDHNNRDSSGQAILFEDTDGPGGSDPSQYAEVTNVRIVNHSTGIRCNAEATWLIFSDVNIEFCGTAYSIALANFTDFNRCIATNCGTAWFIDRTSKCVLRHCTAQVCSSTTLPAIQVVDASWTEIEDLWTERNEFTNILIKATDSTKICRGTRIIEPLCQGAGFTSPHPGWGLDIGAYVTWTTVDGGWFGANRSGDIRTNVTSKYTSLNNIRGNPMPLTITDAADSTMYNTYTKWASVGPVRFLNLAPSLPLMTDATSTAVTGTFTGTGTQFMLSASPTTTGTFTGAISNWSGLLTSTSRIFVNGNSATELGNPHFVQASRDGNVSVTASRYSNDNSTAANFVGRSAQGSFAVQAATLNNSPLVKLQGMGHDSTSIKTTANAEIGFYGAETWTGTKNGTKMFFDVTALGGTTKFTEMNILSTGVTVAAATATTSGGSTNGLLFGSSAPVGIYFGSGPPTISAGKGSLYLRTDGTTTNDRAYINTNSSTTWTALTTAL